jgi:hypothetical protein
MWQQHLPIHLHGVNRDILKFLYFVTVILQCLLSTAGVVLLFKVRIVFEDSPGVELVSDNSTVLACVSERTSFVQRFHIRASDIGYINITVSAEVDPMFPEACGPEMLVHRRYANVLLHYTLQWI